MNMAKEYELYEGKPVFIASDSMQLKAAVAKYKGEVAKDIATDKEGAQGGLYGRHDGGRCVVA